MGNIPPAGEDSGCSRMPKRTATGKVYAVILALDYRSTDCPLSCTTDGKNMQALLKACGVSDVHVLYNGQCTRENVTRLIRQVGSECGGDDVFFLYFSGHGVSLESQDGVEYNGMDEAFCFINADGEIDLPYSCMRDEEMAYLLVASLPQETFTLILTDCSHRRPIVDLGHRPWVDRRAISISGCWSARIAGDLGCSGLMTHALLMAIDHAHTLGEEALSIGELYSCMLEEAKRLFHCSQEIRMISTVLAVPDRITWPLMPTQKWLPPLTQACNLAGGDLDAAGLHMLMDSNPVLAATLGISPQALQHLMAGSINTRQHRLAKAVLSLAPTIRYIWACRPGSCAAPNTDEGPLCHNEHCSRPTFFDAPMCSPGGAAPWKGDASSGSDSARFRPRQRIRHALMGERWPSRGNYAAEHSQQLHSALQELCSRHTPWRVIEGLRDVAPEAVQHWEQQVVGSGDSRINGDRESTLQSSL
eukprot:CAMPEP_0172670072 /NCGR_PEP_ID=MMETSP1074-20121228/10076_1 /TAXON_ID=2916 /ORGANISM="Ceratium fusus, Strain PA161109" /LENGTH=474 /DNA_ID=CAMNT_0013486937 /DNA_START=21 /DNA_END=1445 /DNA_ORIENTATION=+